MFIFWAVLKLLTAAAAAAAADGKFSPIVCTAASCIRSSPPPAHPKGTARLRPPIAHPPLRVPHHACLPHSHWQSSLRPTPSSTPAVYPSAASCAPSSPSSRLALSASSPHNSPMRLDAMHAVRTCLHSAVSCSSCGAAPCAGQTHDSSTRPSPSPLSQSE